MYVSDLKYMYIYAIYMYLDLLYAFCMNTTTAFVYESLKLFESRSLYSL